MTLHNQEIVTPHGVVRDHAERGRNIIDDFDLFISATSIINDMILVTNNTKHFSRIKNIKMEDWTK